MNQILSVEMPKTNKRTTRTYGSGKASTKSVIIFFSSLLLILGIAMSLLGVFAMFNNKDQKVIGSGEKPAIDISQNASTLDIDILAKNEISKVQYRWNNGEFENVSAVGTNSLEFTADIPSGTNTFEIEVTDIKGLTNTYTHQYIGEEALEALLEFGDNTNTVKVVCKGENVITNIVYYYDDEQEQKQEINNSTTAEIEVPVNQGEHTLTIRAEYEDGTTKKISKKIYCPVVERVQLSDDGNSFILKASDVSGISKVKINFNGQESEEEVNSENFEKVLQLQQGENRLILTVYNSEKISITTKIIE